MKNVDNLETLPHGDQLDEGAIFAESQDHPNLVDHINHMILLTYLLSHMC